MEGGNVKITRDQIKDALHTVLLVNKHTIIQRAYLEENPGGLELTLRDREGRLWTVSVDPAQ